MRSSPSNPAASTNASKFLDATVTASPAAGGFFVPGRLRRFPPHGKPCEPNPGIGQFLRAIPRFASQGLCYCPPPSLPGSADPEQETLSMAGFWAYSGFVAQGLCAAGLVRGAGCRASEAMRLAGVLVGGELAAGRGDFLPLGVAHGARHALGCHAADELVLAGLRRGVPLRARRGVERDHVDVHA